MNVTARSISDLRQNHLLGSLPDTELRRWLPEMEIVDLRAGQAIAEPGSAACHVHFPVSAVVSLLYLTQDGASIETAVVGNDGLVGLAHFMGGDAMPSQAVVQQAGQAYRLRAALMTQDLARGGPVLTMLLRYTQSMIVQATQTAACNRYHTIDQQLCRRLLQSLDRSPSNELQMTQEGVARLLGVRREGVTSAALKLQHAGVIRYRRGHVAVLDRLQLEQRACECYAVVRQEQRRLLPLPQAA